MRLIKAFSLLAPLLTSVFAAPSDQGSSRQTHHRRQGDLTDTTDHDSRIVNFALSLERLVTAFYNSSLAFISADDFRAAGYTDHIRAGYERIGASVQAHVHWLEGEVVALYGGPISRPCAYKFPVTTPEEFVDLSEAFQALAVSTYVGAIQKVKSGKYATAYASMLGSQARYANWISTTVKHRELDAVSFEAPGSMNTSWSTAGLYATSCPHGAKILPHKLVNFPVLTIPGDLTSIQPGDTLPFNFVLGVTDDKVVVAAGNSLYAAFEVGLSTTVVEIASHDSDGLVDGGYSVVVPTALSGEGAVWMYIVQSCTAEDAVVNDESIVAGPALMLFKGGKGGNYSDDAREVAGGEQNLWAW